MAQITLNIKLTSESFSLNDGEIVFVDTNYVDGVASGAIVTVIDSASADTYQKVVEETPAAIAALSEKLIQVTLPSKQTPYIHVDRIVDIVTNGSYSYIMYNDNGNTNKRIDTLQTTAQILALINTEVNEPKKYVALLTQSGTNAPTAIVLENTLGGTVVWTRDDVGYYIGTLSGAFTTDKTVVYTQIRDFSSSIECFSQGENTVFIDTAYLNAGAFSEQDGILSNTFIEIRVYP